MSFEHEAKALQSEITNIFGAPITIIGVLAESPFGDRDHARPAFDTRAMVSNVNDPAHKIHHNAQAVINQGDVARFPWQPQKDDLLKAQGRQFRIVCCVSLHFGVLKILLEGER